MKIKRNIEREREIEKERGTLPFHIIIITIIIFVIASPIACILISTDLNMLPLLLLLLHSSYS
jgi:hypothetical protein